MATTPWKIKISSSVNNGDDFLGFYDFMIELSKEYSETTILYEFIKLLKEYDRIYTEFMHQFLLNPEGIKSK